MSQTKRIVLLEHFTNTLCSVCSSKNPVLHNTLKDYQGQVRHISYHHSKPYTDCVIYKENKEENEGRANYYNASGSPRAYLNGVKTSGSQLVTAAALDEELAKPTSIGIAVDQNLDTGKATITINANAEAPSENLKLYVALVEKELNYDAPNGEKIHYNVFRKFINMNGESGEAIATPAAGVPLELEYDFTLEFSWVRSEMYVLAFVQDDSNKAMLNAATSEDQTLSSTTNFAASNLIRLSPNPVTEEVQLQSDVKLLLGQEGKLFNTNGQLVQSFIIKNEHQLSLNISTVESGLFFLDVPTAEGPVIKKLIKQ